MKKVVRVLLFVALGAFVATVGLGVISHNSRPSCDRSVSLNEVGNFVSVSDADAHVGGQCYLDDSNIQTVENKCYRKCQTGYSNVTERSACEVGCSTAISVATR
ncbi:MAG: hypothetical protein CVU71_16905 [Deltaproteobacteria bacterium HGW-Deltaproteobacteria-6]|jgi:hypothetical protein|nr:MAG: hypothetical protein CVU71_16905 [Deltaproteobacteria bacterium HGW-Deltaproteobacteria-6]